MAGKLIECVSGIAGSRLEAGTWLRGIRTVRTDIQVKGTVDVILRDPLFACPIHCGINNKKSFFLKKKNEDIFFFC